VKSRPPEAIELAISAFSVIGDPRIDRGKHHPLINVLVMALAGALAGANGWDELEVIAEAHLDFFALFLDVPYGVPSADTFRRVFEMLAPHALESAVRTWVDSVCKSLEGQTVAVDGKSLKGAITRAGSTTPLHLIHVWVAEQGLLLGQQRVQGAPGEVAAIPELLKRLRIAGATVTADANACTRTVTHAIRDAGADYVLALKGNRSALHKFVESRFSEAESNDFHDVPTHQTSTAGHGRREQRIVRVLPLTESPKGWCDLRCAVMIERTRTIGEEQSSERHYYITSHEPDPEKIANAIRAHWSIENQLHWMLDVAFEEDSRRIRDERSAENYALLCRLALMMLKRSPSKLSVNLKRKKAACDKQFLAEVLFNGIGN
jgi:predicted transposase YbfD/YdcC